MKDFVSGIRVEHSAMGLGTVTAVTEEGVAVAFDSPVGAMGLYDQRWLEMHPGWLRVSLPPDLAR